MIALLAGPDAYLKTHGAKRRIDALLPKENRDFSLEVLDAACDRADDVIEVVGRAREALYTPSFFGDAKVVWLRDANFLPGSKGRAAEAQAVKDAVEIFCDGLRETPLPEGHHLLITADACPPRNTRFAKWLAQAGEIELCGADLKPWEQEKAAIERLDALLPPSGLRMNAETRRLFAQRVGADSQTIVSELEKLRDYLGPDGPDVTPAAIEAVTSSSVESTPFALAAALQARSSLQIAKTVALLRADKNAAFPATAAILNTLNDLCCFREALDKGWADSGGWHLPADDIPQRLARFNGYQFSKQLDAAKRYTLGELRLARHYAVEMRFKLVDTTMQDAWDIIEPVLLRIVARAPRRRT